MNRKSSVTINNVKLIRDLGFGKILKWLFREKLPSFLFWLLNPIVVFVLLQLVWIAVVVLWVVWFVDIQSTVERFASLLGPDGYQQEYLLALLIAGCVLLGMILAGTILLFVYGQKQGVRMRQQHIFVSSVTHELRSPLTSLQLSMETLKTRKLEPPVFEQFIRMAESEISRLTKLVDQILISSRFDKGIMPFRKIQQSVDICELVKGVLEGLGKPGSSHKDRLVYNGLASLWVNTNPDAVKLIISNLVENALKYSPAGSPVEVSVLEKDEDDAILIKVKDRGIGLDKRERKRVFRMFHRSAIVAKKAIPGTGLGLFIVKKTVQMLNGKVRVESKGRNLGTTMSIELPRNQA